MLVGYPDDSISLFDESSLIPEFYCRKHKAIGLNGCHNKGKCQYSGSCYANLHKTPITPYAEIENITTLPWLEKNTKEPLRIKINDKQISEVSDQFNDESETYILPEHNEGLVIKKYWDFIKDYHVHPESKYDDEEGNPCGKLSKGILQRTHVKPTKIMQIGKETNTLQDSEEKDILPEEQLWDDMILTYQQEEMEKSRSKIDLEQWKNLLPILKEKAKPRKVWAERLGICSDTFKQLLAEKHNPSVELFQKILAACKEEKFKIPKPSQPIPRRFKNESRGHIFPLESKVNNLRIDQETVLAKLDKYVFELYGTKYLDTKPTEVKEVLKQWQKSLDIAVSEEKKKAAEGPLKVKGILLDDKDRNLVEFELEDIIEHWKRRIKGRNYSTLVVRTKDGKVYEVLKKYNNHLLKNLKSLNGVKNISLF